MKKLKILCVHGLGDHRQSPWKEDWKAAVERAFPAQEHVRLEFVYYSYDAIFEDVDVSAWEAIKAVAKLVGSGIGSIFRRGARGGTRQAGSARGVRRFLRWYAGYVVAWVEDRGFQRRTRRDFLRALREHAPDVVVAHSLGSLVTYNAFTHQDAEQPDLRKIMRQITYVTLGSQIGNAFIVGNLTHGRVSELDVRWWYHLYNDEDAVFTAPIRLWSAENFTQVETHFDMDGMLDHSAVHYLEHEATVAQVWSGLAARRLRRGRGARAADVAFEAVFVGRPRARREKRRRALLVGINDYPRKEDRLDGCVNDVFLMSSVLQECGFQAEQIRTCLDDRATATGILERLDWLLDDPRDDDELVFYYSGHGAQLPTYGEGDVVDRMDETLVPYDFNWAPEQCITDDHIYGLYSQVPYGTKLVLVFDCCHSGGIHRAGGPRAKGLNPPDDIRHRGLRWNQDLEVWEQRDLHPINRSFSKDPDCQSHYFGSHGSTSRLGRGAAGRRTSDRDYEKARRRAGNRPVGPFLPIILEACAESEFAYEYRHGVTSYGAFTHSLAANLRRQKRISFKSLVDKVADELEDRGYEQHPQILGPSKLLRSRVPWVS